MALDTAPGHLGRLDLAGTWLGPKTRAYKKETGDGTNSWWPSLCPCSARCSAIGAAGHGGLNLAWDVRAPQAACVAPDWVVFVVPPAAALGAHLVPIWCRSGFPRPDVRAQGAHVHQSCAESGGLGACPSAAWSPMARGSATPPGDRRLLRCQMGECLCKRRCASGADLGGARRPLGVSAACLCATCMCRCH